MSNTNWFKSAIAVFVVSTAVSTAASLSPVNAQEFPEAHIAAAKTAIKATESTDELNEILPRAAVRMSDQLIGTRPDIADQIQVIVNEAAIELAPRRGDLEKEVAQIYARVFTQEDLQNIAEFFSTEAGKKFITELPIIVREIDKASRIWGTGINRDLNQKVREKMQAAGL